MRKCAVVRCRQPEYVASRRVAAVSASGRASVFGALHPLRFEPRTGACACACACACCPARVSTARRGDRGHYCPRHSCAVPTTFCIHTYRGRSHRRGGGAHALVQPPEPRPPRTPSDRTPCAARIAHDLSANIVPPVSLSCSSRGRP